MYNPINIVEGLQIISQVCNGASKKEQKSVVMEESKNDYESINKDQLSESIIWILSTAKHEYSDPESAILTVTARSLGMQKANFEISNIDPTKDITLFNSFQEVKRKMKVIIETYQTLIAHHVSSDDITETTKRSVIAEAKTNVKLAIDEFVDSVDVLGRQMHNKENSQKNTIQEDINDDKYRRKSL